MFGIGPMELVLILVVALLVLGPKRMPDLARTLGRGLSEFRRASNDLRQSLALDEIQNELRDGLTGAGTIHKPLKKPVKKPEEDDRPAQAGDDLDPGEEPEAKHPGELSNDLDPHAHHDEDGGSGDSGSTGGEDAEARQESAGAAPSDAEEASYGDPAERDAERPRARAADANLGTVPVSRGATARRRPETDPSAPSRKPSSDDGTGDGRG